MPRLLTAKIIAAIDDNDSVDYYWDYGFINVNGANENDDEDDNDDNDDDGGTFIDWFADWLINSSIVLWLMIRLFNVLEVIQTTEKTECTAVSSVNI